MKPIYSIQGISYEVLKELHDFYMPRTIITSSFFDNISKLYNITITPNALIKFNDGNLTIDLGARLYTIEHNYYIEVTIK